MSELAINCKSRVIALASEVKIEAAEGKQIVVAVSPKTSVDGILSASISFDPLVKAVEKSDLLDFIST